MSKKQATETGFERVIFTLPKALAAEVEQYAALLRNGNKSGFVADALRSYIQYFRKRRHTELLRRSYAASAQQSAAVNCEWEPLDDEMWAKLDALHRPARARS